KLTSDLAPAKTGSARPLGPQVFPPDTDADDRGLGVYVHFPWCIKKCPYCDFLSVPSARADIPHERYASAVLAEIAARRAELGPQQVRSIFFGGGTPSLWRVAELRRVLRGIVEAFCPGRPPPEITVECNPGSLGYDTARRLLDAGVNRLSIGVQGLDDERLRFLGRWHDAAQALSSVQAAIQSGMPRVSADLIYGVAEQSPESAAAEARRLAQLGLSHVSAYTLTIEPQTAFGARARKGRLPLAPEQAVADAFLAVDAALAEQGLEHYEISNFARPGQRAEHNLGYWRGLDYVGLGCGAWGTVTRAGQRVRYRNRPQPDGYLDTALALEGSGRREPEKLRQLESESEPLSADVQLSESLMLGLRLAEGVDVERAEARTGARMWTRARRQAATRLVERGRLLERGPRLSIPKEAWLFSDGIISELL
ncbi:MAG TPA: radical SAM family heme chaperone HemW, partial [Polyangiaceae bacterium]|nr:radical SAM family heme chaperone HemW [Polyangiaceae bacterium]